MTVFSHPPLTVGISEPECSMYHVSLAQTEYLKSSAILILSMDLHGHGNGLGGRQVHVHLSHVHLDWVWKKKMGDNVAVIFGKQSAPRVLSLVQLCCPHSAFESASLPGTFSALLGFELSQDTAPA